MEDWDNLQKNRPARYFVHSIEDGKLRITFDSEIFKTEKGDEDILGNVWGKEWSKVEAKVIIKGQPKIYSLGGEGWSFINDFIACCRNNEIAPEKLPGCVFDITRTGDWTQEIEYVGRESEITGKDKPTLELSDKLINDAKEVLSTLKENSPDLVSLGLSKPDFIKVMSIRGKIKSSDTERLIPELEKNKDIEIKDDKILIL